ncbi:hypothetical protein DV26_01540 [Amycolatopsis mediterranei]|uniref:Uncharacterized protein n=1 Tax=Amycolatopsis mediterranei (strain S699) TaxID=713604 RepID=A0A9R0UAY4_AMYMS|nr:hypothetical protein [Amycolatopsis mediterranei]AEK44294.1 hypothetical protein RAM_29085 [Amycolatopsis mediterranei S699]KDO12629.1 hypothetical protein DV26_01540 [Amycolatopsis mediterranei]KDU88713.1 hypothetical protein DV36_29335 [Amycolatopsis mediterranei]UZF72447.1 hypothetical protein ISP_005802 [Amycolatopsis mediterranei]
MSGPGPVAGALLGLWKEKLAQADGRETGDAGHRAALDLDPDAVDDHHAADARAARQCDLGRPAAERVADHGDVAEAEFVEQADVGRRERACRVHARQPRGACEDCRRDTAAVPEEESTGAVAAFDGGPTPK